MATFRGKTVEEAIEKGLEQLDVPKERAHIKILQAPSNGLFGFGKKEAQVEIKSIADRIVQQADRNNEKEDIVENDKKKDYANTTSYSKNFEEKEVIVELSKYLTKITKMLGAPALVRVEHNHNKVYFHLDSENQGMLIGKHGKILNALQHISQIFIHRFTSEKYR